MWFQFLPETEGSLQTTKTLFYETKEDFLKLSNRGDVAHTPLDPNPLWNSHILSESRGFHTSENEVLQNGGATTKKT